MSTEDVSPPNFSERNSGYYERSSRLVADTDSYIRRPTNSSGSGSCSSGNNNNNSFQTTPSPISSSVAGGASTLSSSPTDNRGRTRDRLYRNNPFAGGGAATTTISDRPTPSATNNRVPPSWYDAATITSSPGGNGNVGASAAGNTNSSYATHTHSNSPASTVVSSPAAHRSSIYGNVASTVVQPDTSSTTSTLSVDGNAAALLLIKSNHSKLNKLIKSVRSGSESPTIGVTTAAATFSNSSSINHINSSSSTINSSNKNNNFSSSSSTIANATTATSTSSGNCGVGSGGILNAAAALAAAATAVACSSSNHLEREGGNTTIAASNHYQQHHSTSIPSSSNNNNTTNTSQRASRAHLHGRSTTSSSRSHSRSPSSYSSSHSSSSSSSSNSHASSPVSGSEPTPSTRLSRNLQSAVTAPNQVGGVNHPSGGGSSSSSSSSTGVGANPVVHSEDNRPLAIRVRNLPARSSDTSLKDGLFHEYKKHGKVTWVKVVGQNSERYALVCFKKPDDVEKALEVSHDKLFFGCKIEVEPYQGYDVEDNEFRPYEAELDEYHPKSTRTLFIGNLEKEITASELRGHFECFGEIIEIDIKKQGMNAYAFCQYSDIVSVVKAMRKMDGEHLGNNRIKLGFGKSMPTNCVWIDGVGEKISESHLQSQFSRYGTVTKVIVDRMRQLALVLFDQIQYAQTAVKEMRGATLRGRKLQVDFASRECQDAFYEKLEKQSAGSRFNRYDSQSRSRASSFSRHQNSNDGCSPSNTPGSSSSSGSGITTAPTLSSAIVAGSSAASTSSNCSLSSTVGGAGCTLASVVAQATPMPGSTTPARSRGSRSSRHTMDYDYMDTRRFRSYDEYSQGSGASHDEDGPHSSYTAASSGVGLRSDSPLLSRLGPIVGSAAVAAAASLSVGSESLEVTVNTSSITGRRRSDKSPAKQKGDIRILQKERSHLLEQLEECPSSGDESIVSPRKRIKIDHHHLHNSSGLTQSHLLDPNASTTLLHSGNVEQHHNNLNSNCDVILHDSIHRKSEVRRLSECNSLKYHLQQQQQQQQQQYNLHHQMQQQQQQQQQQLSRRPSIDITATIAASCSGGILGGGSSTNSLRHGSTSSTSSSSDHHTQQQLQQQHTTSSLVPSGTPASSSAMACKRRRVVGGGSGNLATTTTMIAGSSSGNSGIASSNAMLPNDDAYHQHASRGRGHQLHSHHSHEASGGESADGSRPGTPLCDERPEVLPTEPRRLPRERPHEPMVLPLPKFGIQFFQQYRNSVASATATNFHLSSSNNSSNSSLINASSSLTSSSGGAGSHMMSNSSNVINNSGSSSNCHSSLSHNTATSTATASSAHLPSPSARYPHWRPHHHHHHSHHHHHNQAGSAGVGGPSALTASPLRPRSLSSNSSDSDVAPNNSGSPSLEERIRTLDEMYERWSGGGSSSASGANIVKRHDFSQHHMPTWQLHPRLGGDHSGSHHSTGSVAGNPSSSAAARHKFLGIDVKELQPSDIVKSVLAKKSIFDDDLQRLKNINDKYEPTSDLNQVSKTITGVCTSPGLPNLAATKTPVVGCTKTGSGALLQRLSSLSPMNSPQASISPYNSPSPSPSVGLGGAPNTSTVVSLAKLPAPLPGANASPSSASTQSTSAAHKTLQYPFPSHPPLPNTAAPSPTVQPAPPPMEQVTKPAAPPPPLPPDTSPANSNPNSASTSSLKPKMNVITKSLSVPSNKTTTGSGDSDKPSSTTTRILTKSASVPGSTNVGTIKMPISSTSSSSFDNSTAIIGNSSSSSSNNKHDEETSTPAVTPTLQTPKQGKSSNSSSTASTKKGEKTHKHNHRVDSEKKTTKAERSRKNSAVSLQTTTPRKDDEAVETTETKEVESNTEKEREKVEREKREKREKELKKQQDREERDRKEKEERERKEREQREEKERKQREERERKEREEREKKHRLESEKRERERRENEEKEECERKEREEFERKEREECERKQKEEREEKAQEERDRKDREEREKEHKVHQEAREKLQREEEKIQKSKEEREHLLRKKEILSDTSTFPLSNHVAEYFCSTGDIDKHNNKENSTDEVQLSPPPTTMNPEVPNKHRSRKPSRNSPVRLPKRRLSSQDSNNGAGSAVVVVSGGASQNSDEHAKRIRIETQQQQVDSTTSSNIKIQERRDSKEPHPKEVQSTPQRNKHHHQRQYSNSSGTHKTHSNAIEVEEKHPKTKEHLTKHKSKHHTKHQSAVAVAAAAAPLPQPEETNEPHLDTVQNCLERCPTEKLNHQQHHEDISEHENSPSSRKQMNSSDDENPAALKTPTTTQKHREHGSSHGHSRHRREKREHREKKQRHAAPAIELVNTTNSNITTDEEHIVAHNPHRRSSAAGSTTSGVETNARLKHESFSTSGSRSVERKSSRCSDEGLTLNQSQQQLYQQQQQNTPGSRAGNPRGTLSRKIILSSADSDDSEDTAAAKKHSIFDIPDEGPYVSMYDKVKARSCKNMQKQEEEKKIKAKFSQLKQSRAKREEKKRSTSYDGDSDSDFDERQHRGAGSGSGGATGSYKHGSGAQNRTPHGSGLTSTDDEENPAVLERRRRGSHSAHNAHPQRMFSDSDSTAAEAAEARRTKIQHNLLRLCDDEGDESSDIDVRPNVRRISSPSKRITIKRNSHTTPRIASDSESQSQTATDVKIKQESIKTDDEETIHGKSAYVQHIKKEPQQLDSDVDLKFKRRCSISSADDTTRLCFKTEKLPKLSAHEIKKEFENYMTETGASAADSYNSFNEHEKLPKSQQLQQSAPQRFSPEGRKKHKKSKKRQKAPQQQQQDEEQQLGLGMEATTNAHLSTIVSATTDNYNTQTMPLDDSKCGVLTHKYDPFDELKRESTVNLTPHTNNGASDVIPSEKKRHKDRKEKKRDKLRNMSVDVGGNIEFEKTSTHTITKEERHRLKKSKKSKSIDAMRIFNSTTTTEPAERITTPNSLTLYKRSGGEKMEDIFGPISDEEGSQYSDKDLTKDSPSMSTTHNSTTINSTSITGPIASAALNPYKQEPLTPKSHTVEENEENKQKVSNSAHLERERHRKEKREKKRKEREKSREQHALATLQQQQEQTADDENSVDLDEAGRALEAQLMEDSDNKLTEDATPSTAKTYRSDMTDVFRFSDADENSMDQKFGAEQQDVADVKSSVEMQQNQLQQQQHNKIKEKKKKKKRSKEDRHQHHQRRESSSSTASQHQQQQQQHSSTMSPPTASCKLTIDVQAAVKHAQKTEKLEEEDDATTPAPICKPSPSLPCLIGDDDVLELPKPVIPPSAITTLNKSTDMLSLSPMREKHMISPIPKTPTSSHVTNEKLTPTTPVSATVADNVQTTPTSSDTCGNATKSADSSSIVTSPTVSSTSSASTKKKSEKFIPGFDGEVDEKLSESAVQSISTEFHTPSLDPSADEPKIPIESPPDASKHLMDKIEDTKSRVTISQEETESAVSALLGESFGNSFNDDVSFNDDEDDLSAVDPATVVPPEPDEEAAIAAQAIEATAVDEPLLLQEDAEAEMLKAVQSLNPSLVDMDIKADTPQSVQELQIDTDTEENADEADSSGHSLKIDENAPTTPENKQQSEIASASVSTEDTKGINVSQKTSTTHSVIIKAASDNLADFSSTNSSNISSHTTISPAPQKPLPPKIEPPKISNSEQPPVQPVHAVLPSMMNLDTVITSTNANLESLQQAMTTTTAAIPHKFTSTPVKANAAVTAATKHATTIRPPLMNSFVMQPPTISIPPETAAQFTMPIVLSPRGNHASEQQIMLSPHQQVAPPQSPVSAASYINVSAPSPHSPHLSQSGASRGNTPTRQLHSPAALSPTCPQQSQQHLLIGSPGGAALQQQQQQQQLAMGQQRQQQTLMSSTSTSPNSGNGNNSQLTSSPNINMQRPITTGVGNNNNNRTQQHSPQFNAVTDGGGKLNSSYATPSARNPPSGLRSVIEQHPGLPIAVHKMPPVPTHPTIISKVVSVPPQQAQQSCSQQQQPLKNFYTQSITPQQHQQQQQLPQHQRHSPQVLQQISKITAHQQQQQQQYMQQQHILQQQRQQIQQQQQQHRQQHHQQMQQQIMQQHQQQMLHMQKKVNQQQQQQQQHHQQPQQQPQTKPNYHLQQQQQQYHQQQQQHMLPLLNPQQHQQQQMLQQQQQQQSVTTSPLNKAQQNLVILRQQHINTGHVPSNQQQQPATQNLQTPQKIIVQQHIVGLPPIEVGTAAKSMLQQQQQQHSPVLLQQHPPVQQQQHSAKPILQQTHYQVQHPQSQQPISTTATQNSTTTAAATTPTSTVSTASSNAPKQAELENITMVATATDKQQQESLQKTESLAPISSEKLPESSGIQKFIIENVSVIRTPTPTTTVAEATISDNKDIRSSLLTEENVIKISSPKADETEQEDSKEDSDYWSAKEVNIDSVIKKVDATCIREELQQQQQQQQQEKVHTNPPPIVASSSKTSDSSTKAPPEEVDKPASEVEKPFDCNANPNVAITNTSSTTDHETEDETETTRSGGALATIGVGKGSTRGGGVTKRGRQPRGGKKQAALPQSQPQPTTVTPPAETTISGIQTRLRKPTPAATATRGRKGRPPTRHLAQQQQLLQQQQLQQQQLQQATTVGNVSVNMSPTPTSSESRKSRTTSGSSAASNSATATTAANSDQDVYEFHDDSAGEEPQVKSTGAPACTNAPTASHTAGDARPRIILTIKSPGQATPIVMATEKPIATTATEQKQLQTSTTQIANSSSSSSSTHPTQQLTDSAGANILQSPQQQSIVAGTSDIAEQQIKSTPDPVPVPATNADFPNLSNVTSASGVTVSALTRKSRRLQEKDRSTIDDIIEDVVRNTQPNQAQAAAMSQIPKGAQTPPRRSGRNAVQPKKDGNISSPVVLSNTTPQSMVGRLRRPKDRKSSAEAVTTIGSHAGTSDFVEAEKNLTETVAPQIDDAPSKQQALETIHAATSIPPASVTAVEITRTPSTTQPPPTSTTTNAIIPQHPKKKALAAAEIESFSTNSSSSSISAIPTTILPPILHTASAPASQKCTGGGAADVVNKSLIDPVTGMISSMQQGKEGNLPAAAASGIHHQPQQQPHKQMPHDPKIMMQAAVTAAVAVASNENQLTESSINSTNPKTQTQLDVRAASPSNNNNNSKPQNISLPSNVSITPSVTSIATPITAPTKPIQLENAAAASLSVPSNIPTPTPTHLPNKAVSVVVKTSTAPVVIQQHLIQPQIAHQGHGHAQTPSKQQIVVQQSPQPLHAQPTGNVRPPTLKAHVLNSQKQFQQQQQQVPTTVVNQQQQQLLQQQSSAGSHVIQTNIAGRNTLQHQQQQMPLPTSQHQQLLVNIPSTHTTHAGPTMQSPRLPQQQQPSIVIKQNQPVQLQQQQQQQVVHVVGAKNSTTASPHISIQQQVVTVAHSSKQHQQHLQHQYQNQMHMPSGPMILQQQQMQTVGPKSNPITQHSILKQQQHNIVKQQQIPAGVSVVTHQQIGKQQAQQHHASQQQAQQHHAPQQQLHMKQQQQSASLGLPPGNLIGLPPHAVAAHQMAAVAANLLQSKTAHLQSQQHHTPSPPLQQQQQQHVAVKQNPMVHNMHTQNAQMMACAIGSSPPPSTTLKQQQQHNISNIQQPQQQIVATGGSGLRTTIPTISPQGQARAAPLLLPSGLPVPPFEANMGETTFPPGPIRGVPREHIILYQQYLRGQDTMGAVPRIPYKDVAGAELDETLAGSPPLELRRPGSVPRTIAVPHSLQSPQDRATDSPQVAQVYVHNTRIPPPHPHYPEVAGRFFDVGRQLPIDPPPAHRSATAHSVVAPPPVVVPLPGAAGNSPFIGATSVQPPPPPPSVAVSTGPPTTLAHLHPKILVERERERELREREQHLQREQQQQRIGMATAGNNATTSSGVHDSNLVPAQAGRNMQVATPPHTASQGQPPPPPQADSLLTLLQRYPVMWQGLLALKTDQAAVQMHFVFGNPNVARASLPCNSDGTTPPLRIAQRMRLEQTQLEGVAKKMQFENEHCMLLALPCGRDHADVLQQSRNLQTGFITYLQQKMAAGIVNIPVPGSEQAAYVVHIFPSCDFANENLERAAPDLKNRVAEIAHLLIVIATV